MSISRPFTAPVQEIQENDCSIWPWKFVRMSRRSRGPSLTLNIEDFEGTASCRRVFPASPDETPVMMAATDRPFQAKLAPCLLCLAVHADHPVKPGMQMFLGIFHGQLHETLAALHARGFQCQLSQDLQPDRQFSARLDHGCIVQYPLWSSELWNLEAKEKSAWGAWSL
ncbi:uncharacterized protein BKA78DRAFT_801 [Phyllosticta capitalensis]|uniref:uncharacterized protein n=1 Tax=Phyllosticta capitalensis TaxID=121624 RepID=UPI00312FC01E